MPKTISVGNTQEILCNYIADNQVIDIKKENPGSWWNRDPHLQIQF